MPGITIDVGESNSPAEPKASIKSLEGQQTLATVIITLLTGVVGFFFLKDAGGNPMVSFDQLLKLFGIAMGGGTVFTLARHWLKGRLGVANGGGNPYMGDNLLLSKLKRMDKDKLREWFEKLLKEG